MPVPRFRLEELQQTGSCAAAAVVALLQQLLLLLILQFSCCCCGCRFCRRCGFRVDGHGLHAFGHTFDFGRTTRRGVL